MRKKLLRDKVAPTVTKSKTDKDDPRRAVPKTASDDPIREKLRRDKLEPRWAKSTTDKDDPRRAVP
jgi:hypothetical protein